MKYVAEWFRQHELTHLVKKRRVYVASDDPKVGVKLHPSVKKTAQFLRISSNPEKCHFRYI